MKEFEKWLSKECDDGQTMYPQSYDDCERAWKAALKWALKQKEQQGSDHWRVPISIIKEELDEN